jgi:carbon-monoxide dehydrogenase medium subunit
MVGLAGCAHADGPRLRDARLVFFGVGATPVRARRAEAALTADGIDAAAAALGADLDPPDDVQATGKAKRHLAAVLLRRVARQLSEPRS